MAHNIALTAAKREGSGKGAARAVRRTNNIPAVIYGDNKAPVSISLNTKEVTTEYQKGHLFATLCDLNVDGEKFLVIARDVQKDPVSDTLLHADFLRVTARTQLRVEIPVHFEGQDNCPAIKEGGSLTVVHHEVPLMVAANAIPEQLTIDISGMEMGHSIKLSDLTLPAGSKPAVADAADFTVATLSAPRVIEEEAPIVAAEGAAAPAADGAKADAAPAADAKKEDKK